MKIIKASDFKKKEVIITENVNFKRDFFNEVAIYMFELLFLVQSTNPRQIF